MAEKNRYSDEELEEFRVIINEKLSLARRDYNQMMRQLMNAALEVLERAGITCPDAIIAATRWGCIVQSVRFLNDMISGLPVRPTDFMQSTHNTIASSLAIRTHAHGYNTTYSDGDESLMVAQRDAAIQLSSGRAESVLVLHYDEIEPEWQTYLERAGIAMTPQAEAYLYINQKSKI